jgi:STE24 endopeptidase
MTVDAPAATAAYIDGLGADTLAKAAAYTTGNHWLLLWGLLVSALVALVIVRWGVLDRVEARLGRRGPNLRAFVVGVVYFLVSALLSVPWALYEEWWREKAYGRTSQPLADFLGQGLLSILIAAVLGALFFVGVYALIRRAGRAWWAWSAGLTAVALSAFMLAAPVVIEPLFNDF